MRSREWELVSTTMLSANVIVGKRAFFVYILFILLDWQQGTRLVTAWKDTHHIGKVLKLVKRMVLKTIRSCKKRCVSSNLTLSANHRIARDVPFGSCIIFIFSWLILDAHD